MAMAAACPRAIDDLLQASFAGARAKTREVRAGAMLLRQGQRLTGVELILSGVVYLESLTAGQPVLLGFRGRGWPLGAASVMLHTPTRTSAKALNDCTVLTIAAADFHRLRRNNAACAAWLQAMQSWEVEDQLRKIRMWAVSSCQQRLDQLLVELVALASEEKPDGSIRLTVPMAVEQFSCLASMRRETASRHLGARLKAGTLVRTKGWFSVPAGSDLITRVRRECAGLVHVVRCADTRPAIAHQPGHFEPEILSA